MPAPRDPRQTAPAGGFLDWRNSSHWADAERPCRYCEWPTHLRDDERRPAHKVCAEAAGSAEVARAAAAYRHDRFG